MSHNFTRKEGEQRYIMTIEELRQAVVQEGNDFYFDYKEIHAGVEFTAEDGIFYFSAWYGDKVKDYGPVEFDDVVSDKFYDGKSVAELLIEGAIDIDFA